MLHLQTPLSLTATRCHHVLEAGRTRPWIIVGEDAVGSEHEIVVKLRGNGMTALTQAVELVSSLLAQCLGIETPRAALVDVTPEFIQSLPSSKQEAFARSTGLNFATSYLRGVSTVPQHMILPKGLRAAAISMFAFDFLIQNPDRRTEKPNVLTRQDSIIAIDHEQGFNWLSYKIIGSTAKPWENVVLASSFTFMSKHLFRHELRTREVDLLVFQARLAELTNELLQEMKAIVPVEWVAGHSLLDEIVEYLLDASQHSVQFINNVNYLLQ